MKISIEIPEQRICDLMCAAVEHNPMTTAWCGGVHIVGRWAKDKKLEGKHWYCDVPELWGSQFVLEITDNEDGGKVHRVNQESMKNAFRLMATKYGAHFGQFMNENGDAITADVFLQLLALGEVIYG